MRRGIEDYLRISCNDVDLKKLSNIEFYMRQGCLFRQYAADVISSREMVVIIPLADATALANSKPVELQFAFTDAEGIPRASEVRSVPVGELLKEAGYDPTSG